MGFSTIQSIWREGLNDIHMRSLGDALVRVLKHAGPVYVKIGQILSTREDLLPEFVCQQLARLYDEEHPRISRNDVINQLAKNYPQGNPFTFFDEDPLGVGSVSQVHRATLPDGREVAVKVLRPYVGQGISRDIESAKLLVHIIFETIGSKAKDWQFTVDKLIDDLGKGFVYDVDLEQESLALMDFKKHIEGQKNVFVPASYPEYSTREVMVMDIVPGIPLSKLRHAQMLSPDLSKKVASLALKEIVKQIVEVGVFHPDPHGGNLILMPDDRLGMIDLAQGARFSSEDKAKLVKVLQAIILRDVDRITQSLLDFADEPADFDRESFKHELRVEIDNNDGLGRFAGKVLELANRYKITMTADTVALVRSLITVEALSKSLDPDFNTAKTVIPTVIFSFLKNKFKGKST